MGSNIGARMSDDASDAVSSFSVSVSEGTKLLRNGGVLFIPPIGSMLVYLRFLMEVQTASGIPVHKLH